MATTTYERGVDSEELDRLAMDTDGDAARPAIEVEPIADACELVARWAAALRSDEPKQHLTLAEPRGARR